MPFIDDDFVAVRKQPGDKKAALTLTFGDEVEVLGTAGGHTQVRVINRWNGNFVGFIKGTNVPLRDEGVMGFSFVDVQQGDGMLLTTPEGKVVLIDGGDNKLFARHLAARFRHKASSDVDPMEVDLILITHGDADHFDGLNDIKRSEDLPASKAHKRLFIHPKRVYHNGLVKSLSRINGRDVPDLERFGRTVTEDQVDYAVELFEDTRNGADDTIGAAFERWNKSLDHWETRGPIETKRLAVGMDEAQLFDFLHAEGITVELQGPFTDRIHDPVAGGEVDALPFLSAPPKGPEVHLGQGLPEGGGSPSASHTINGHSVALRLTYGNVRMQLTGDLNRDAMQRMRDRLPAAAMQAEIMKAPHHGSHDFDFEALKAVEPVAAIVSSGDEDVFHEHIHPRATLIAALGKVMRGNTGVIFSTELAAFFHKRDYCHKREDLADFFKERKTEQFTGEELRKLFTGIPRKDEDPPNLFYGFERTNFGIVHLRTDGERVLAFTHSGKKGLNEAYRFRVDANHDVTFESISNR